MRILIYLLIAGNLLALFVGVTMQAAPGKLHTWFGTWAGWITLRRVTKPLDVPRNTDRFVLRHPRLLGATLLASAILILIKGALFVAPLSAAAGGQILARLFPATRLASTAWETLWLSSIWLLALGALLALAVGLLALFRMDWLESWSALSNRWISTRRVAKPAAKPYFGLDRLVRDKPRLWGGLITLLTLYTIAVLVWFVRVIP